MRSGGLASTPSPTPAAPLSDRVCDGVVVAFALWTIAANAVVAAGRGLIALLVLYALLLAAAVAWWLRGPRWVPSDRSSAPHAAVAAPRPLWWVRFAALLGGVVATVDFAIGGDVLRFWWLAIALLGAATAVVAIGEAPQLDAPPRDRASERLLWLMAAAGLVVMLISHRPDADDAFYMNVAVSAADVPQRPLLAHDTMHGVPGLTTYLPVYRVHSFELLNGAIAYLTGIPVIYAFQWVTAGFAALLVPLAHARLFRILTPRRWLASVVTCMVVLVAVGETHRWYGNFAFVRMWQGKAAFLFVFMPLVHAYALRFGLCPNRRDWVWLALAQIGAVGSSSSALWVAPLGAGIALCAGTRLSWPGLKTVIVGAAASAYVLAAAWLTRTSLQSIFFLSPDDSASAVSQPMLYTALSTALGDGRLLVVGVAVLLTAWVFAPTALARRFALLFPLVALLGLLNPYIAAWVPMYVTGPSYWRSMWVLPVPILIALVLSWPVYRDAVPAAARRALWLAGLAAFALLVPHYSGLSVDNSVRLDWPGLKVPDTDYQWATAVNASVPPRSHVAAATNVSTWIVTQHHHVYPLVVRHYLHTAPGALTQDDLIARGIMQSFLDHPELVEANAEQFRHGLERFQLQAVCLVSSPQAGAARALLTAAGFRQTRGDDAYELWVRSGEGR